MNFQYTLTSPNHHHRNRRRPPPLQSNGRPTLIPCEETLRAEVIYLHSLWHQGPPPPLPCTPQSTLFNNSVYTLPRFHYHHLLRGYPPSSSTTLDAVTNPTRFKKKNKNKKKKKGAMTMHVAEPDPGPEWPVMSPVPESQGWPDFKASDQLVRPVSEEVQTLISDKGMQKDVVECCRKYFYGKMLKGSSAEPDNGEDGGEVEDEEYLSDEDEEEEDEDQEEDRDFKFLLNLFVENQDLREYYEKKEENGALYCLVCGGIGVKVWKSFKGCLSLVQHCNGIEKTKRRRAHRALARVICQVLGWDFDRLPTIVLKGETLGRSLTSLGQDQDVKDGNNVDRGIGCMASGNSVGKFVIEEASDEAKNMGEMLSSEICHEGHVNDTLVLDPGNVVDAAEGCGEPVNHDVISLEKHGKEVNECVHALSVCSESGKENLKGDNYVGSGVGDGNPGETTVNGLNENV